ncbi:uncharacterized protein LOC126375853 [Pectinophora gossypiella]|uniref:uncharacterized protein LOC126375853 n=1 Tax=Pectinophora gossypiella TaxID=13191 RepID=UPI00214EC1A2|nr:uncharacterized protein LOC126375853 [Pectinophora gossypiella]
MDSVQTTMESLAQMFNTRMAAFEEELGRTTPRTSTVASLTAEFQAFRAFVVTSLSALQKQVEFLTAECDNLEMRTRRKMLLLHGVPEVKDEDTPAVVLRMVNKHLALSLQPSDFSRAIRMGRMHTSKPRPILIKFSRHEIRAGAWQVKTKLKGSGFTLSEFLTKRRHDLFVAARKRFGVTKCWTRDGHVIVSGPDGKRHRVSSLHVLNTIPGLSRVECAGGIVSSGSEDNGELVDVVAIAPPVVKGKRAATAKKSNK